MKRFLLVLVLFLSIVLVWGVLTSTASLFPLTSPSSETHLSALTETSLPDKSPTVASSPFVPPSPTATPSPTQASTPTLSPFIYPTPSPGDPFKVRYHPNGNLYVSDLVSLEVIAPPDFNVDSSEVIVEIGESEPLSLGPASFSRFGIAGRIQATFMWAWDTDGLHPGDYDLVFTIIPQEITWTETVTLLPESQLPLPEPFAYWAHAESDCCLFHYITGTSAERDLEELMIVADEQARLAAERIGIDFTDPITVSLMPRVLGHGGFAGREIYISYLDRNYAGDSFPMVVHHEMIHILDARLGGDFRPTLFVEGLSVYLTGGHFKPEPLISRAVTLLELDSYIPLSDLADDFYPSQHEIGYLQAGALVEYMVDTWGWEGFSNFYRSIQRIENGSPSQSIDIALQNHFDITFSDLEEQFISKLHRQPLVPDMVADVRLTVDYYDSLRRYQQSLDPSAYFMTAWLPNIEEMRQRGILADLLRHPSNPENIALEAMFVEADMHLRAANFLQVETNLQAINAVLDAIEEFDPYPFQRDSLSADYFSITNLLLDHGYELNSAQIEPNTARVQASLLGGQVVTLVLVIEKGQWQILSEESGAGIKVERVFHINYPFPPLSPVFL